MDKQQSGRVSIGGWIRLCITLRNVDPPAVQNIEESVYRLFSKNRLMWYFG